MLLGLLLSVVIYAVLFLVYITCGEAIMAAFVGTGAAFEAWRPEPEVAMHWLKLGCAGVVALIVARDLCTVLRGWRRAAKVPESTGTVSDPTQRR